MNPLEEKIFQIQSEDDFSDMAMHIFRFQAVENLIYAKYLKHLGINPQKIKTIQDIPFLPIEFFKSHEVICGDLHPKLFFESSGTSGQKTSRHYIASEEMYKYSFRKTFSHNFGNPDDLCILALLPSYLERENSSLVYMMDQLIKVSSHQDSDFYLDNLDELSVVLEKRRQDNHPTLLLGVSFALLDLAEKYPISLPGTVTIMETGGMKGRRKEIVKAELHSILKQAFDVPGIHSEYGMTELLSQAYADASGRFISPPWMKILIRDPYDPLTILPVEQSGAINIIDLANMYSCSFIATGDLGRLHKDASFEVAGRMDSAEIRGCNLMVTN